ATGRGGRGRALADGDGPGDEEDATPDLPPGRLGVRPLFLSGVDQSALPVVPGQPPPGSGRCGDDEDELPLPADAGRGEGERVRLQPRRAPGRLQAGGRGGRETLPRPADGRGTRVMVSGPFRPL